MVGSHSKETGWLRWGWWGQGKSDMGDDTPESHEEREAWQ